MANQKLRNTYFYVPDRHQKKIGSDTISYENLKKKKHIFDNLNLSDSKDKKRYKQLGGHKIKTWVEETLRTERGKIKNTAKIKSDYGNMDSQQRKDDENDDIKVSKLGKETSLNKNRLKDDNLHESKQKKFLKKATLCIIENDKKEFLLLLRSKNDTYMPNHWGYAGGGVDEGENPLQAVKREIIEETLMDVYDIKLYKERVMDDTLCYIFIGKTDEEDAICSNEHDDYGWYKPDEIRNLKTIDGVYSDIMEYVQS